MDAISTVAQKDLRTVTGIQPFILFRENKDFRSFENSAARRKGDLKEKQKKMSAADHRLGNEASASSIR